VKEQTKTKKTIGDMPRQKTKFHNFNETFTQYTNDELDDIIKKSQKEKFK
ncbi:DNA replication protein DnaD, partial [Clostridioides difficile]|nr:DNA replication protein DnaD [Clostridioides difficile]